jgi:death on curing protein
MTWIFLQVETVQALHTLQIELFGGSPGLRDLGLLESAVARAENKATYDEGATIAQIAASLGYGLIKNHAFIDGNKRVGYTAVVVLLDANGFRLTCSEEEETEMVRRVAASEVSEEEWTAWVERSVEPIP